MRLEKIVVHGFKSFVDKTEIQILPGITAIVGPNGCGKCLSGETPVVLADGHLVPIRELVETALTEARTLRHLDDGVVAFGPSGIEVLSLNPETLRLERRPVEAFIRRTAPPFLLRVRTHSGREVVTTHYHPFFTLEHGALKVLTAETLSEGTKIALPRCLPVKPRLSESVSDAVCSSFAPEDRIYLPPSRALQEWIDAARHRAGGWKRLATLAGIGECELRSVMEGQAVKVSAVARIARSVFPLTLPIEALKSAGSGVIRLPQEVDGRLARFLGYLIAEGRNTKSNQVWFVNSDPSITTEFSRLARELFGVKPREMRYKATATDTLIFSKALCLFLDRVCGIKVGSNSAQKSVPPQILAAPDEVVWEFLSGLFEGDAYVNAPKGSPGKVYPHVEYVTASRRLAEEVSTLLLRLGIFALIRPKIRYATNTRARHRRTYYGVYVYGIEQLRRLASQLRFVGLKQSRLDALLQLQSIPNPNLDLVPGVTPLVRAAISAGTLPIKPLRPLSPKLAAYAEGRCEASRAGLHEVADLVEQHGRTPEEARPFVRQLRALAESDLYWDEVAAIERIAPPEPWVYDLTVAETHNFVAGNVIVHNSNIADAVRWALGEQSPKTLRGHKMEDVIFTGSASRKPLGMAEVGLLFSNDGTLSVPWSEVQVSRRLYRTGESEYLLNKASCRLRDVMDLFIGTGVNPKAYALMEQERLNQILTAKPLDRRIFIEEAAGISRYKQQRTETLGKLEAARQNLQRVRDVMAEVKRQLGSLERQARKARQYKAMAQDKQSLALVLLAATHAALTAEEADLQGEMDRLRDAEEGFRVRLSSLEAQQATQRVLIQDTEHRLSDLRQSVQKVQGEVERLLERREQLGFQVRELADEDQRLVEEARLIGERRRTLEEERRQTDLTLSDSLESHRLRGESVRSSEETLSRLRELLQAERERLETSRLEQVRAAGARVELTRSLGELRERESQIGRRRERLAQERSLAEEESLRALSQRERIEAQKAAALEDLQALGESRTHLEATLAEREAAQIEAQARFSELRLVQAARRSSLEALERLEREREGYSAGVRAVFSEAGRASLRGVVGTVADLLDVPSGLEAAVEAALGERLTWVVVERFDDGKNALGYLFERGAGPATFLPLETLPSNGSDAGGDDGLRWLGRLVGCSRPELLCHLLGRVAVVSDLSLAESLWRRNGVEATYVTPSGEALAPAGRLTGGRTGEGGEAADHSLLRRKAAIRALKDEVGRLDCDVVECQERLGRIEAEVSGLKGQLPGLQQSIQSQEALRVAAEKDLEQVARETERISRYILAMETEDRGLAAEAGETRSQIDALDRDIAAADQAEANLNVSMAELRASVESQGEREVALAGELTAVRVEWAALGERVEALRREIGHIEDLERDLVQRVAQSDARRQEARDRREALSEERLRADRRAQEVAADRDRLEGEEAAVSRHYQELLSDREGIEAAIREHERELSRMLEGRHAVEIRAAEDRVRRQEIEQEALRGFGVEPADILGFHDPSQDLEALRARLNELEEKLLAMGAVNLVADEEYRELEERLGFLQAQHDDLTGSMKDLDAALRGMTHTAQARFREAFEAINGHFGEIFSRLFEGGRAELRLVEAEEGGDPLEAGVDLMAQPRGKRLQAVTLLSGGEKALTGLALLFAIFYYRPSPFCVLDEVDAPLDDANIHRFLRVLRELCRQTQFIVITHNRNTMEAADLLYGITMEEPGLSRLVSVKLAD